MQEIVSAAAMAFRAYQKLGELAGREGMEPIDFVNAVAAECERLDAWVAATNRAEDRVFSNAHDGEDQ